MVDALRQLPRLHGLRDRVPVGRALRPADRGHARAGRAPPRAPAPGAPAPRAIFALFPHPGRLRALAPVSARLAPRLAALGARPAPARLAARSRRPRRPRRAARLPEHTPAHGDARGTRRLPAGLRPARVLRRRQRRDRRACSPPRASRSHAPARAALLRRAAAARRRGRARASARRRRSRRFEDYDTIVVNAAGCGSAMKDYGHLLRDDPSGPSAPRRSPPRCATSPSCSPSTSRARRAHPVPLQGRLPRRLPPRARAGRPRRSRASCCARSRASSCVEPAEWEICCGSAGIYNLSSPSRRPSSGAARRRTCSPPAPRRSPPPTRAARCRSPPHPERLGHPLPVLPPDGAAAHVDRTGVRR